MIDKEAEFYEQRAHLNEPPPEEPTPAQKHIEAAKQRVERNSWRRANQDSKLLLDALRKNGDAKLS